MRIAFYSDTFLPQVNGVVRSLATLAETLHERGHEIEIHTTTVRPSLVSHDRAVIETFEGTTDGLPGWRIVRYPSFTLPMYRQYRVTIPTFRRWRRVKTSPDIIHAHTPFGVGWEAVAAAKRLGCPLVGTHHTLAEKLRVYLPFLPATSARRLALRYTTMYYRRCDAVTASSRALAAELADAGLAQPIAIISNPLATDRFTGSAPTETLKTRFGLSNPSLLYHGRTAAENRLEVLLGAMAELRRAFPALTLAIAGDGPTLRNLKQTAARLGVADRVRFPGMLHGQDLVDLIAASDMFVSPSDSENQSMALLEAMAAGLAVVATRGGGTPEHVVEDKNASLVEPGNIAALAAAVRALLENQTQRIAFGRTSKTLSSRFDRVRVAEELERLYDAVCDAQKQHNTKWKNQNGK